MVRDEPGGILGLCDAISGERWGDIEADFQAQYCGLDARGIWKHPEAEGFIGARRFLTLLQRLPDEALSRTTPETRLQNAQAKAWDANTELLAQLVDLTAILVADRRTKGEPYRVERPGFLTAPPAAPGDQSAGFAHAISVLKATART